MMERNLRKERTGTVTSNKMDKSIVVSVEMKIMHPKYGKFVKQTKKFMAHDETGECGVGDVVKIMETRPMSKLKRWRMVEVIEKAK
ncbi:MAG: 30S ribosomal protein S17 [Flavobacteriales bacterium]|nr:30S ribosomal protein S17 [Flavobacteriales bacterium]MDP4717927.1 30S ribosomal protein S17 [Flavobacteriales bacterium]MDP4732026.1 30S ribosomal protein S17 [Flavobacteriales bacterium]MDP4817458.1 30S ribosomal protein S17 [Flavobacteriales bacterium]MDP4950307.1 30S ribosomal protein S17 [Flavobacteriales bacterium]